MVLPLQARMDLGVMAMKGYSALPKAPAFLYFHHQIVSYPGRSLGESYISSKMQLVCSTILANWAG